MVPSLALPRSPPEWDERSAALSAGSREGREQADGRGADPLHRHPSHRDVPPAGIADDLATRVALDTLVASGGASVGPAH